jgi:hypothetical protein
MLLLNSETMQQHAQLMNGQTVTNEEDRDAMRKFIEDSFSNNNMVQYIGMDGYNDTSGRLPGYVTCKALRNAFAQAPGSGSGGPDSGRGTGGGGLGGVPSSAGGGSGTGSGSASISMHGVPMEPINILIRRLYKNNEKALVNCAFVVDLFGFQRCVLALMKKYDLRSFFGGMTAYHDSQRMANVLGVKTEFQFMKDFSDGRSGQVCV